MVRAAKAEERNTLHHLSAQFEQLASELLQAPWAHGDLKPENIVVSREGELQLIDFD
jgi:thiamine kinase-like enzyme